MAVGCSKKSENDEIVDIAQTKTIIAEYLEDVEFDRNVWADIYFESRARVDVLGLYEGKWIAVRYGYGNFEQSAPAISPDIDYYLNIPKGDRGAY